jgi:hypothetical protein
MAKAPRGDKPPQDVDKSAPKSAGSPPGIPFTGADDPRRGRGPAPGAPNAGRPPNEWKAKMAKLADRWQQTLEAQKVLEDPEHEHFMAAGKFCAEQAHGAAAKRVTLEGDSEKPIAFDVVVRREA